MKSQPTNLRDKPNLRKLRHKMKISQVAIAKEVEISQNHYSNIETGVRKPSPEVAQKIAKILGFPNWYSLLEN